MKFIAILFLSVLVLRGAPAVPAGPFDLVTYTNISDMVANASTKAPNKAARVLGYYLPGDGGGGMFYSTNTAASTNRGLRFQSLVTPGQSFDRIFAGNEPTLDVRMFGAQPAIMDNSVFIQEALDAGATLGKSVLVPAQTFRFNRINVTAPIMGYGDKSVLEPTDTILIANSNISVSRLKVNAFSYVAILTTNQLFTNLTIQDVIFTFDPSVTNRRTGAFTFDSPLAVDSSNTGGFRIQNCRAYGCGFQFSRANNLIFTGNYIDGQYNNWNELVHASQNSRTIIADNVFLNSFTDPLDMFSSGSGCRVVNNIFDGWGDPSITTNTPIINTNIPAGFNEAVVTMKVIIRDTDVNSSGPVLGFTENTVISGNTFRNGRPTLENARVFGIMLKMEDLRTNVVGVWNPTNASRNVLIANNIFDGFWTNNPGGFANIFFAGVHADGTGIDISHNIFRDISLQNNAVSASGTAGVELGFNLGTANGTSCNGCTVAYNTYEGEGSGIIVFNATNTVIEANIVREDYTSSGTNNITLKPRYGMIINGNMSQCVIRGNQFAPTFLNPAGILQLGSTNYIVDCLFDGNFSTKTTQLAWFFPRVRDTTFKNNSMGTLILGTANDIQQGNTLRDNRVFGNGAIPGFDILSQRSLQIVGNYFTNNLRAINLSGGTATTDTDFLLIHDNYSFGESGTFIDTGTIPAATLARIIRYNNFANNVLRPSGGNMNLGGQLNTGSIISSGFVQVPSSQFYGWANGTFMFSAANGFINLFDSSNTNFGGLLFGGTTVNDIGIFKNPAIGGFHFRAGNNSTYTNIYALNLTLSGLAGGGQVIMTDAAGKLIGVSLASVSGYTNVQDESVSVTQRGIINFIGAGVTATDDGSKTVVTIPGAAAGMVGPLTGDVTTVGSSGVATTLATVNGAPGTFGNSNSIPIITVNGKGLATVVTSVPVARYIALALSNPTVTPMTANQTNYISLPVALTLNGVTGKLLKAGTTTTTLKLFNFTVDPTTPISTISLTSGNTTTAGAPILASVAANDFLVGVVDTVGTGAYGAQLVLSYSIP